MNFHAWSFRLRMWWYRQDQGWRLVVAVVFLIVLLAMVSSMAGCSLIPGYVQYKEAFIKGAGEFYDEQMTDCEFWLCDWSSGAAINRFWTHHGGKAAHDAFCGEMIMSTCEEVKP